MHNQDNTIGQYETVVLLHGFLAPAFVMHPLRIRLTWLGYNAVVWHYPSIFPSIQTHSARFRDFLKEQDASGSRFHIVAHSMGSVVTRSALVESKLSNLGRLVFLAPPSRGTPIARWAPRFLKRFILPLKELEDIPSSFVNQLPESTGFETGIVEAKFDILVPAAKTHLKVEAAHCTVNGTHNSILLSSHVARLVDRFLRSGSF